MKLHSVKEYVYTLMKADFRSDAGEWDFSAALLRPLDRVQRFRWYMKHYMEFPDET
jgi:hypothetical protein